MILGYLEGHGVHQIELSMHATLALDKRVRRHVPTLDDRVAHAFLVEGEHLGDRPVKPLERMHACLLHAVLGMPVPIESGRFLVDPLCHCLEVSKKLLRKLPLDAKGLPPMIKGDHGLLCLGGHTAVVEDHVEAVLGPPGVGVDREPFEGSCREVFSRLFGGAFLLLLRGGAFEVDDVLPHCLGAGLLLGGRSSGGLALLGLRHCGWRLVLVPFVVGRVVGIAVLHIR